MTRTALSGVLLLAATLCATIAPNAQAATRTWTGGVSPSWSGTGNWSGGVVPVTGDDLVFPDGTPNSANVNDLPAGTSFTSITVAGQHQITGNAITLTGATALAFASPTAQTITFNPSVTLTNPAATIATTQPDGTAVYVNLGVVTISGGSLTINAVGNLAQVYFTQPIGETSTAAIQKIGVGEALFTTDNTYTGITTVNAGYIGVGANGGLGVGTNIAANGTVVNNGGTLFLYNGAQVPNERVVLNGSGQSGNGSFQTRSGDTRWGGEVVLADPSIAMNLLGSTLSVTGRITGSGDFRFGRSPVIVSNSGNDYSGATVVGNPSGGNSILSLGASEVIPDASAVTLLNTSTLATGAFTETIGSLAGTGEVYTIAGALNVAGNASSTFAGRFVGGAAIHKTGTSTLTLTGASNSYGGTFTVSAGKLALDALLLTGSLVVDGGILSGSGVGDLVSVIAGGTVAPGGASPGKLTMTSMQLSPGGTFTARLNGLAAGTAHDQLAAQSVSLGGTLNVTLGLVPATGDTFRIVDNTGSNAVSGVFAGLPEGTVFAVNGTPMRISYVGGTGNDVTLTVVAAVPALAVTTSSLPGGTVGTPYAAALTASGGTPPYTWSLATGSLPPGVTLNVATGALTGTPTTPGTYPFSVTVTDSAAGSVRAIAPKAVATAPFTIVIAAAAPVSTEPVPTLGSWMLMLLAMLTALGGMLAARRR